MIYSVIVPSLWRLAGLQRLVASVGPAPGDGCEIVVVAGDDDTAQACDALPVVCVRGGSCAVEAFNLGAAAATGDWLVTGGDDNTFRPGWRDAVEATPNQGFVGLWEGQDWTDDIGLYAIRRDVAWRVLGGVVCPPVYRSGYADIEVCALIRRAGLYAKTRPVVADHYHYTWGKSPDDATYARGRQWQPGDKAVFESRKASGFPITWAPIIKEDCRHGAEIPG
jgi:hypothetical protein